MNRRSVTIILVLILILAAFLRLYRLDMHDVITDEVFYGYRSIGLIDSLNSPYQSTPFEWYEEIPTWARVSFHDHPPLGFWIQHLIFRIFDVSLFTMRLPFALAGVISVLLAYLIARKLFHSELVSLFSALILAINNYHVWISRIGLQESLVIFFLLLAVWLFLKALEEDKYCYLTVVITGLAMLMKYTAIILLPLFLVYLVWKRRDLLNWQRAVISAAILLVILSPAIIYNVGLYEARGHFDFQISYLLGQEVPEWELRPGRDVGGFDVKVVNFFVRFSQNYGVIFTALSAASLVALWRNRREQGYQFLLSVIAFLLLLLLVVGPQERFLSMLSPFLAVVVAGSIYFWGRQRRYLYLLFIFVLLLEAAFAVNTNHLIVPKGSEGLHYSLLRRESNVWGYNQLEEYFLKLTKGYYSEQTFPLRFAFTGALHEKALNKALREGREPKLILFIADSGMHGPSALWYVTRHTVYERWPIINEDAYLKAVEEDPNFFTGQGIEEFVFIRTNDKILRPDSRAETAEEMERLLLEQGSTPISIKSLTGEEAFRIFHFD